MMRLICEVFETIVTRAFTIAVCDDVTSFTYNFTPSKMRLLDESRSTGSFIVKNDFIAAADGAAEADTNFIEINLKHAAQSAMQSVAE